MRKGKTGLHKGLDHATLHLSMTVCELSIKEPMNYLISDKKINASDTLTGLARVQMSHLRPRSLRPIEYEYFP